MYHPKIGYFTLFRCEEGALCSKFFKYVTLKTKRYRLNYQKGQGDFYLVGRQRSLTAEFNS